MGGMVLGAMEGMTLGRTDSDRLRRKEPLVVGDSMSGVMLGAMEGMTLG
jgi:hypothetical protein